MHIHNIRLVGPLLQHFTLVEVELSDGTIGIGLGEGHGLAMAALIDDGARNLRKLLTGMEFTPDPAGLTRIWREMTAYWGAQSGPVINAMGAIDMALWDAAGKVRGLPICRMLSDIVRPRIMAYASATTFRVEGGPAGSLLERKTREELVEEARHYAGMGFEAIKFGWGNYFGREDRATLVAIREALGSEIRFMLDFGMPAHWAPDWNVRHAKEVLRFCDELNIYFLEEPLPPFDGEGYRQLRGVGGVKVAGGEMLCMLHEFRNFIEDRAVDIIQPDASRIGITQFANVVHMAEAANIPCVPHSPWSALAIAAHVQVLAASACDAMVEYPAPGLYVDEGEMWGRSTYIANHALVKEPPQLKDGFVEVPCSPGLGVGVFVPEAVEEMESLVLCRS